MRVTLYEDASGPSHLGATDTAASPRCCKQMAGRWARTGFILREPQDEGIWRREGLKVLHRHRPRSRLWLNDGSCMRLRPLHRNHNWSFDLAQGQTCDGRSLRNLTLIDEHSRTYLALKMARRNHSAGVDTFG